jgi:hypothetical protein
MLIESFVGGSHVAQSPVVDCERAINLMVEVTPPVARGAKTDAAFYARPGVSVWKDVAIAGAFRATFEQNGRAFGIIHTTLYEFDSAGNATSRGTVAYDTNPATITSNGDGGEELGITSGDKYYAYDLATNTLTEVLSSGATMCDMLDGYILILDAATSTLWITDLFDAATVDPTQFAQRSLAGDRWQSMKVSRAQRTIYILGSETGERWYNRGTFPFPFTPITDALIPYGIAAPFSLEDVGGMMIWVTKTSDGQGDVVMASGAEPRLISNHALHVAFDGYDAISGFISQTFTYLGHRLYLITAADEDATWVFDLSSGVWVEWLTWVAEQGQWRAWRPLFHMFAFGKHLMGDREKAVLYELGPQAELQANPVVMFRMSWNSGKTWSAERMRSTGAQGQYDQDIVFERCGSGTKPVVEFSGTDAGSDVDGRPLRWVRVAPLPWANNARLFCARLELLHEPGLGTGALRILGLNADLSAGTKGAR